MCSVIFEMKKFLHIKTQEGMVLVLWLTMTLSDDWAKDAYVKDDWAKDDNAKDVE